jgi:hypothetical protein
MDKTVAYSILAAKRRWTTQVSRRIRSRASFAAIAILPFDLVLHDLPERLTLGKALSHRQDLPPTRSPSGCR